jgi:hypothetical protein
LIYVVFAQNMPCSCKPSHHYCAMGGLYKRENKPHRSVNIGLRLAVLHYVSLMIRSSFEVPSAMTPDQPDRPDSKSEQGRSSLNETIDQANRAIEGSRAEIARSQALGQSVADLNRELERISEDENNASRTLKDER